MLRQMQVTTTVSRGRLAWHDGEFKLSPGSARFVETPPNNPRLFSGMDILDASSTERLQHTSKLDVANKLTGVFDLKDEL